MYVIDKDDERLFSVPAKDNDLTHPDSEEYRTEWRKDFARLIHCPSFRRLQGKTQLYPGIESDFFRNRLTHSMEVAQIAKSIAIRINSRYKYSTGEPLDINTDIVEFAGLAHDLGHPPFGHQGEEELDELMKEYGGFEGNAQTLRILSKIEKRKNIVGVDAHGIDVKKEDKRIGLNLTPQCLAAILKYDNCIPYDKKGRETYAKNHTEGVIKPVKGYYKSEESIVNKLKERICNGKSYVGTFKTVECQIMDVADDIAYSTYDLEDGLKAGFFSPLDILFAPKKVFANVGKKVSNTMGYAVGEDKIRGILSKVFSRLFKFPENLHINVDKDNYIEHLKMSLSWVHGTSKALASNGFARTDLTSFLIGRFIRGISFELNEECPALSKVSLQDEERMEVEVLKTFTFESQILSPKLKIVEFRGREIVHKIFTTLVDEEKKGYELLPDDCRELYEAVDINERRRVICDFVAGMTDKYAIEFYGRLTSEMPETIFKPI